MNTSEPKEGESIRNVSVTDDAIIVDLYDGRNYHCAPGVLSQLTSCPPEQRSNWRIAGAGYSLAGYRRGPEISKAFCTAPRPLAALPRPRRYGKAREVENMDNRDAAPLCSRSMFKKGNPSGTNE